MKVLHLLSNWKWTERSEPAVDLAVAQSKLDADIRFVCGRSPTPSPEDVAFHANLKGLDPVDALELPKHFRFGPAWRDFVKLRKIILKKFNKISISIREGRAVIACKEFYCFAKKERR